MKITRPAHSLRAPASLRVPQESPESPRARCHHITFFSAAGLWGQCLLLCDCVLRAVLGPQRPGEQVRGVPHTCPPQAPPPITHISHQTAHVLRLMDKPRVTRPPSVHLWWWVWTSRQWRASTILTHSMFSLRYIASVLLLCVPPYPHRISDQDPRPGRRAFALSQPVSWSGGGEVRTRR